MIRTMFFIVISCAAIATAAAGQSLIPTPYPSGGAATPLDPADAGLGGPQHLVHDPYPQLMGTAAQGNPDIVTGRRHQHLARSSNQRRYRVDRIPIYPTY